jgi:Tol biopolymer transport system component
MNVRPRLCATVALLLITIVLASPQAAPRYSDWSEPVNLGPVINSPAVEGGPTVSKDGLSLYFHSNGPGGLGGFDVYVSQRASVRDPWGTPQNLGAVVNSAALEATPALSRDEHWLFLLSDRAGGVGQLDLWASYRDNTHDDFAWQTPVNLGPNVNSASSETGASFFQNDETGFPMLFFGSARPGGFGGFDLYVSTVVADGTLGPAILVPELSSGGNEQRPSVRFDGLEMFFHSDRLGSLGGSDIWVSTRETLSQAWSAPVNLGPVVNSTSIEQQPHIASDRETLYFQSNRPGGFGSFDIYITTRTKLR